MFEHNNAKQVEQKILYSNIQSGEVHHTASFAIRLSPVIINQIVVPASQGRAANGVPEK